MLLYTESRRTRESLQERLLVVVHKNKSVVISTVPDSHIFWMESLLSVARNCTELKLEISLPKVITQHSPETMSEVNKRGESIKPTATSQCRAAEERSA